MWTLIPIGKANPRYAFGRLTNKQLSEGKLASIKVFNFNDIFGVLAIFCITCELLHYSNFSVYDMIYFYI